MEGGKVSFSSKHHTEDDVANACSIDDVAEEVYDRLHDKLGVGGSCTYVAAQWEDFLALFGFSRSDQSRVSHALKALSASGLVSRESVKSVSGYHASRRCNYPKPRRVKVRILR